LSATISDMIGRYASLAVSSQRAAVSPISDIRPEADEATLAVRGYQRCRA